MQYRLSNRVIHSPCSPQVYWAIALLFADVTWMRLAPRDSKESLKRGTLETIEEETAAAGRNVVT